MDIRHNYIIALYCTIGPLLHQPRAMYDIVINLFHLVVYSLTAIIYPIGVTTIDTLPHRSICFIDHWLTMCTMWCLFYLFSRLVCEMIDRIPDCVMWVGHNNNTPLHIACRNNHVDIASLLLEKGSEVNSM